MESDHRLEHSRSAARRWRLAAAGLAFAIAGAFVAQGQPAQPPVPPAPPAGGAAVQPSDSVEATAMAIAYSALRGGDAKVTPQAIGQYAAEVLNAFSGARK